jgi:glycosyltransferase involved in cell wall biosynthesis
VLKAFPKVFLFVVYKPTYFHRLPNQKYVAASASESETETAKLETLIGGLGIGNSIRLIRWNDQIDDLISACDLIVAPFLSPRFSSVNLLEAMAMGKPIIATDLGEQREIIKNGINGYLVPPAKEVALAEKIVAVLSRPDELKRLSGGAKTSAESYSVDSYVESLQQLYSGIAISDAGGRELKQRELRRVQSVAHRSPRCDSDTTRISA